MSSEAAERRLKSRIKIDSEITYRLRNSNEVQQGLLEDMSDQGARIWIQTNLPAGSQIFCLIESDEPQQPAIEFKATLLRGYPQERDSMYGYGCSIDDDESSD